MNVLLAQMPIVDADVGRNLEAMLEIIESAGGSADLIVFPETTLCGFPDKTEVGDVAMTVESQAIQLLKAAARRGSVALAFGFAEQDGGAFYNTAGSCWIEKAVLPCATARATFGRTRTGEYLRREMPSS